MSLGVFTSDLEVTRRAKMEGNVVRSASRRDAIVASVATNGIMHAVSAGTASGPPKTGLRVNLAEVR